MPLVRREANISVEVRVLKRFWILGLALVGVLLVFVVQAAPAGAPAGRVKQTRSPIATLAMDGPRVAYASGGTVYVWNVLTGASSTMKGKYSKHASEVAIAGTRVEWITRYVIGNSLQTQEHLFSATIGSRGRLLASGRRLLGGEVNAEAWYGRWIAGAVGSGKTLAVGTWWSPGDGTCTGQKLNLVSSNGLKQIVVGPGAIIAQSVDSGRIAVLRSEEAWPVYGQATALETSATVGIYSASGQLLQEITPSSAEQIALSGDRLVVLTQARTLEVYNWKSATLVHTWPAVATARPLHQLRSLAVYGQLAVYSTYSYGSNRKLHVLHLTTGKDVVLATGRGTGYYGRDAAIGPRGLVYAVNYHEHGRLSAPERGKLVFVPLAKVLQKVR
jgi:hypothetical protein